MPQETKDELAGLRQFMDRLESGRMKIRMNDKDVTQREIGYLKQEIKFLESIVAQNRQKDR